MLQEAPEYVDARRLLASAFHRNKYYDAAIKELETLLHSSRPDHWVYFTLGAAQAGKKQWKQAVSSYRGALLLDPSSPNSYIGLGLALVQVGNRTKQRAYWEEAEHAFKVAMSLQPDQQSAKTLAGLANAEWHLGNKDRAIDLAKAATEANPKYSFGWIYLIRFQTKSGKVRAAWRSWQGLLQTKGHFENERAR